MSDIVDIIKSEILDIIKIYANNREFGKMNYFSAKIPLSPIVSMELSGLCNFKKRTTTQFHGNQWDFVEQFYLP